MRHHDYDGRRSPRRKTMITSPREDSTMATIDPEGRRHSNSTGRRRPMEPRHDEPQENVHRSKHTSSSSTKKPRKKSSSSRKPKETDYDYDDMDDASREAHIVQKIERAIKKSKSERKAAVRSRSSKRASQDPPTAPQDPPTYYGNSTWEKDSVADENYQMINKQPDESRTKSRRRRSSSAKSKQNRLRSPPLEHPIPLYKTEGNKYKRTLIDLDEQMDNLDMLDGIVDDKKGFQVNVEDEWLKATFSDPTLDTYEDNHFIGRDHRQQLNNMLDPQRIQCGPGRSATGTADSSMITGRDTDPVIGIIDRINEKKHPKKGNGVSHTKRGERNRRDSNHKGNHRSRSHGHRNKAANDEQLNSSELISFDNYEDDDGYYYEDDEDDDPIYPSSRPGLPQRIVAPSSTLPEPALVEKFSNLMQPYKNKDSDMDYPLQSQLDEINRLQGDIQRQQELINEANRHTSGEEGSKPFPNPRETSAEVYKRELARQAQAEIHRMELEQKAMMLERQMDIYMRNKEEWDKVRNIAIKEEEARKRIVEQAKKAWQDDMHSKLHDDDERDDDKGIKELRDDDNRDSFERSSEQDSDYYKRRSSESGRSHNEVSTKSSGLDTKGRSLYDKVAELNNRAEVTDEDQKTIEAEILKELHMELSKQAAEKKIIQKPLFFSDKLRSSWSGKQPHWANSQNVPTEVVTKELSRQIQQLGLEMAPSRYSSRARREESRRHSEDSKRRGLPLFKSGKAKNKDENLACHPPAIPYDDDSGDRISDFTSEPDFEERQPQSRKNTVKRSKKGLLGKLGFRRNKDKKKQSSDVNRMLEGHGLIMSSADDYIKKKSERPQHIDEDEPENDEDAGDIALSPRHSDSNDFQSGHSTSDPPADYSSSAAPEATQSQSTKRTSNKVYIGVNENSIETMSCTPRNNVRNNSHFAPSDDISKQSSTVDRYASLAGGNAKVTPGLQKRTASSRRHRRKYGEDDPTLFEYLEVQYFPNDVNEEDEEEAPDDELEADVQLSQRSGGRYYHY